MFITVAFKSGISTPFLIVVIGYTLITIGVLVVSLMVPAKLQAKVTLSLTKAKPSLLFR